VRRTRGLSPCIQTRLATLTGPRTYRNRPRDGAVATGITLTDNLSDGAGKARAGAAPLLTEVRHRHLLVTEQRTSPSTTIFMVSIKYSWSAGVGAACAFSLTRRITPPHPTGRWWRGSEPTVLLSMVAFQSDDAIVRILGALEMKDPFRRLHYRWVEQRNRGGAGPEYPEQWAYEQCGGCHYWLPIAGPLGTDWGVCANFRSPFDRHATFEHDGCEFFLADPAGWRTPERAPLPDDSD